jgi:MFS superfamily sulfate permease-like transporter
MLASLPPEYGLYASLFPALIYWIFGTSHHVSIGAYAVISIMVANTISKLSDKYVPPVGFNSTANEINRLNNRTYIDTTNFLSDDPDTAKVIIASSQCLWIGLIHVMMGILRLGVISSYMSESLVGGFTAGSAFHVVTTQLSPLFGLKVPAYSGAFKIIKVKNLSI